MKKKLMITLTITLGALPFIVGGLQNWYMLSHADSLLPYRLISVFFLLVWGCIAFVLKGNHQRTKEIVIFLNLIAALDLLLIGVQELIFHAYWMNSIGGWSQLFYLPMINLGFGLTNWSHSVFPAYVMSFALMVVASFVGCILREKLKK